MQSGGFNWFFMTPSIATKFQYVNSPLFSFSLTTYFGPYGPSSGEIQLDIWRTILIQRIRCTYAIWYSDVICCTSVLQLVVLIHVIKLNIKITIVKSAKFHVTSGVVSYKSGPTYKMAHLYLLVVVWVVLQVLWPANPSASWWSSCWQWRLLCLTPVIACLFFVAGVLSMLEMQVFLSLLYFYTAFCHSALCL
jgi:hypothetical protein